MARLLYALIKKIPEDNRKDKSSMHLINVIKNYKKPHEFEMDDLCRLHWLVLKKKTFNILEFGSGFSTFFIAHACNILSMNFKSIKNVRVDKISYLLTEENKLLENYKKESFIFEKYILIKSKNKLTNMKENMLQDAQTYLISHPI